MVKKPFILLAVLFLAASAWAGDKARDKEKEKEKKGPVDSGTFGIYLNGKRIGAEKFSIEQQAGLGVATAEITVDDGTNKSEQSSEMRVAGDGTLKSYKWRSTLPTKEESTIEPDQELLIEHLTTAEQKKRDVPYILPLSTVILDDNFFSQRELLIWRYLQYGCTIQNGERYCGPAHFGILVPRQHSPGGAVVEPVGRDKVTIKGTEKELNKFKVDIDGVQWLIWVDDQENNYKVMKMAIPGSNIEVWRD